MNEQTLSKRLAAVAHYVPENARIADIGSDHAYLPAWLILNHRIEYAIAGEVVTGPYQSALKLVEQLALEEQISVRLGDGLAVLTSTDKISAITIAGMGGSLIAEILTKGVEAGKLTGQERLILQPNVGEQGLRKWLMSRKYTIMAETILCEDDKFYEVIVAEKQDSAVLYTERELTFGPHLLRQQSTSFKEKWRQELLQQERIQQRLRQAKEEPTAKVAQVTQLIQWIQEVIE